MKIATVNFFPDGVWCYSAWGEGGNHDHNGVIDDADTAEDARNWINTNFPGSQAVRVKGPTD